MAKAKARKGSARRRATSAKSARTGGRKSARKPSRKTTARKAGSRKTAPKSRARKGASKAKGGRASTRRAAKARPRIGKAKAGPRRKAPLANPRGSSGPRTNPFPTRASTRTGAGAGVSRSPYLERERKRLREVEESVPTPPSSLDLDRSASAVRTGRAELREALHEHTETSPALTGGDVDADWQGAYSVGDEAAGGDNPTPDQQRVDDIGKALGLQYQDNEELEGVDKLDKRDKHRWELDPASSEDYRDRQK
jgi:hypothetical protein